MTPRVVGWDTRKFLSLVLITAILTLALLPAFVRSQPLPAPGLKNGPFVDKIQFKTIVGDDQLLLALLNDEVDLIGDIVDYTFFDMIFDMEDIEIASRIRNGYGFFTINCAKYPFNITAFRRAAAFALDKYLISFDILGGCAQPQDSVVPVVSPWTIEGQLPYSYYDANTEFGNQLLNEAGFADVNGDGFREAPDGSNFSVLVESASSSSIAREIGTIMAEGLQALHVNATSVPTHFSGYLDRLNFHGDYDMMFLAWNFGGSDVDFLGTEWASWNADEPFLNFPNFRNDTYDSYIDDLLHSTDYQSVYDAAIAMQEILVYECPYIVCYENLMFSIYRTDRFEGFMNDALEGVPAWWTGYKVHLKSALGGPFGGTLRWSNSMDIGPFNHMIVAGSPYHFRSEKWLYDSLIRRGPDGNDIAWLAESYSIQTHYDNAAVPENRTRLTFNILRNVTWSDGDSLTAEDVAFTLNYYRNALGSTFAPDLMEMTSAYAPSEFVFVVEFAGESYWHLHTVGYKPIIPMHVFTEIGPENWTLWDPNPPAEEMVTSGPFNVSAYETGELLEFTYNPNYFLRIDIGDYTTASPQESNTTQLGSADVITLNLGIAAAVVVASIGFHTLYRRRYHA